MRAVGMVTVVGVLLLLLPIGCVGCWLLSRTAAVVDKELSPEAVLRKYEHFKNLAAALDAKRATIKVSEQRLRDGALIAHVGLPDRRVPISYALTYPARAANDAPRLPSPSARPRA